MTRVSSVVSKAKLAGHATVDTITLDRAARYRRRVLLRTDSGLELLLDLPEATYLADGDALQLDDGRLVLVKAAAEDLYEIHAHDPLQLARIAWHLGNRHTPCEITTDALYIQPDHVLAEMVAGLGGQVHRVRRPFEPEGGAYGGKGPLHGGHHHGAAHQHDHDGGDHSHGSHDPHQQSQTRRTRPKLTFQNES